MNPKDVGGTKSMKWIIAGLPRMESEFEYAIRVFWENNKKLFNGVVI